jgi:hypothetical protein
MLGHAHPQGRFKATHYASKEVGNSNILQRRLPAQLESSVDMLTRRRWYVRLADKTKNRKTVKNNKTTRTKKQGENRRTELGRDSNSTAQICIPEYGLGQGN